MNENMCLKRQEKQTVAQGLKEWRILIMMYTIPSAFPKIPLLAVKLRNIFYV